MGQAVQLASHLTGTQEVPPVITAAAGSATVDVAADRLSFTVTLNVTGLVGGNAAHIHAGEPGVNGPVLFTLASGTVVTPLMQTFTAAELMAQPAAGISTFEDAINAMLGGGTHINVHSATFPGGEIRGHVGPTTFTSILTGGQEVPATAVVTMGTATVVLNGMHQQIQVTLTAPGLADITAAHIHAGGTGINGPVIFPLATGPFTGSPDVTLTAAQFTPSSDIATFADAVTAILAGLTYVNVHTTPLPAGAIRGQLGAVTLHAVLSGTQETTPTTSTARGTGTVTINAAQDMLTVSLDADSVQDPTGAHIHLGALGVSGGVLFPVSTANLDGTPQTSTATDLMPTGTVATLDDAVAALLEGRTYFNVHTAASPDGEIRGQIGRVTMNATLSGANEVPPVVTTATGTALVTLDGAHQQIEASLDATGLTSVTGAHLHAAPAGMNGPVIFPLPTGPFPETTTLTATELVPDVGAGINTLDDLADAVLKAFSRPWTMMPGQRRCVCR